MDEYTVSLVLSLDRKKVLLVENEETGRLSGITAKIAKGQSRGECAYKSIRCYTEIFVNGLVEVFTVEKSLDGIWLGKFSRVHYHVGSVDPSWGKIFNNACWVSIDHLLSLPSLDDIFEDKLLPPLLIHTLQVLDHEDKSFNEWRKAYE